MTHDDALVGLRFELGGGLGRVAGQIVGKAGDVYLIRKDGADYLELFELDDLRSAKFYEIDATKAQAPETASQTAAAGTPASENAPESGSAAVDLAADPAPEQADEPGDKPKLSEQIRRAAALRLNKQE